MGDSFSVKFSSMRNTADNIGNISSEIGRIADEVGGLQSGLSGIGLGELTPVIRNIRDVLEIRSQKAHMLRNALARCVVQYAKTESGLINNGSIGMRVKADYDSASEGGEEIDPSVLLAGLEAWAMSTFDVDGDGEINLIKDGTAAYSKWKEERELKRLLSIMDDYCSLVELDENGNVIGYNKKELMKIARKPADEITDGEYLAMSAAMMYCMTDDEMEDFLLLMMEEQESYRNPNYLKKVNMDGEVVGEDYWRQYDQNGEPLYRDYEISTDFFEGYTSWKMDSEKYQKLSAGSQMLIASNLEAQREMMESDNRNVNEYMDLQATRDQMNQRLAVLSIVGEKELRGEFGADEPPLTIDYNERKGEYTLKIREYCDRYDDPKIGEMASSIYTVGECKSALEQGIDGTVQMVVSDRFSEEFFDFSTGMDAAGLTWDIISEAISETAPELAKKIDPFSVAPVAGIAYSFMSLGMDYQDAIDANNNVEEVTGLINQSNAFAVTDTRCCFVEHEMGGKTESYYVASEGVDTKIRVDEYNQFINDQFDKKIEAAREQGYSKMEIATMEMQRDSCLITKEMVVNNGNDAYTNMRRGYKAFGYDPDILADFHVGDGDNDEVREQLNYGM